MAVPIRKSGAVCGTLRTEIKGLYTFFYGEVSGETLSRVTAVFEGGTCDLGVPAPEHGRHVLRRSIPTAKLPKGRLKEAILQESSPWKNWEGGCVGGIQYPRCLRWENRIRIPWNPGEEIRPMEPLLLYRFIRWDGKSYLELQLSEDGTPCISDEEKLEERSEEYEKGTGIESTAGGSEGVRQC